jgi:hypothetical protein
MRRRKGREVGLRPMKPCTCWGLGMWSAMALIGLGANATDAHVFSWPLPPPRPADVQAMLDVPPLPPIRPKALEPRELQEAGPQVPVPQDRPAFKSDQPMGPFLPVHPFFPVAPLLPAHPLPLADRPGDNEALRAQVLASGKIIADSLPPVAAPIPVNANAASIVGCGIEAPVRLSAIVLANGDKVVLSPPAVIRASLAATIADWVRDDLEPAIAYKGDRLAQIREIDAYQCRSRDHIAGAKLSEHAIGNAMDLQALVTAKGKHFDVAPQSDDKNNEDPAFLALMKKTACQRFMTVLGPGSDGYHSLHVHIDLEARRSGMRLCEWNLPPVTADRSQPAAH